MVVRVLKCLFRNVDLSVSSSRRPRNSSVEVFVFRQHQQNCVIMSLWCLLLFLLQNAEISVFEVNIRFVGGLLSAYYLSGKEVSCCVFSHAASVWGWLIHMLLFHLLMYDMIEHCLERPSFVFKPRYLSSLTNY